MMATLYILSIQTILPMHPPAVAEKIPIEKRSKMIDSTVTVLNANIIHIIKEHKFDPTIIIRFPRYCDIKPPTTNPMMHPSDEAAPKVFSYQSKEFTLL